MPRQKDDPLEQPRGLGGLFGRTDPPTSRESAEAMKADPRKLAGLQRVALDLVTRFPGSTARELAHNYLLEAETHVVDRGLEWARITIGRRLSELDRARLIHYSDMMGKIDPLTGRRAVTWWPGERGGKGEP